MRLPKLLWITIALLLTVVMAACGGGGEPAAPDEEETGAGEAVTGPVDPATAATISGNVLFTGTAPEPEPILMDAEPICQEKHPDGAFRETVVVNDNGTLMNVFVYSLYCSTKMAASTSPTFSEFRSARI